MNNFLIFASGVEAGFFEILGVSIWLYAEIHYTLKGIHSRLTQASPEIIADMPHRLEPGSPLPITVLIKDADRYPVRIQSIDLHIHQNEKTTRITQDLENELIDVPVWSRLIELSQSSLSPGEACIDVEIQCSIGGCQQRIRNDNYKHTSHAPLRVRVAEQPLPKEDGWHYGDFHCHTIYTSDQVEFGAPLLESARMAKSLGLSFFCATDHSYDLDDQPDDYLRKDPLLQKWDKLWREAESLNAQRADFVIIPGEEVSAGNSRHENVHALVLNNPEFLPGDGDGAEKWLRTRPTTSLSQAFERCNSNSATFAAHPAIEPSFLERLLVRRGRWQKNDFLCGGLHGLQIWNGNERGLEQGKADWVELLLTGRRIFIVAGNDAHGNFNRFRQIRFPFLSMHEHHENIFGKVKTAVYLDEPLAVETLLHAIKQGRMIITDGPFLIIEAVDETGIIAGCGGHLNGRSFTINVRGHSSSEFGAFTEIRLWRGHILGRTEELWQTLTLPEATYQIAKSYEIHAQTGPGYLRAEAKSCAGNEIFRCFTNPIWLSG